MTRTAWRTLSACLAIAWLLAPALPGAVMVGDRYTSQLHQVSFSRPDQSWELRDNPVQTNAVAAFSNGEGRAVALLLHIAIKPSDVVSSPAAVRERWGVLASQIAAAANAGEGEPLIETSRYEIIDGGVEFDIHYRSNTPGRSITNWVSGFILRDLNNRQHIYAVRCAAGDGSFDAWQSQFERIAASVQYDGSRAAVLYTNPPIPVWWWFAGVAALLGVVFLATRRRDDEPPHRLRHPVTIPGGSPAGIGGLPPVFSGTASNGSQSRIPAADGPDAPADLSHVPDAVFYSAGTKDQLPTAEMLTPAGKGGREPWICACSHTNHATAAQCELCHAPR